MIVRDLKIEVRVLGALLALSFASNMVLDALWILSEQTMISKVARLSTCPWALVAYWLITSALIMPFFLMQTFGLFEKYRYRVTQLACRAVMAGAFLYGFLAFLARNLDYDFVMTSFIASSFLNMSMAVALAYGINRGQIRAEAQAKAQAEGVKEVEA